MLDAARIHTLALLVINTRLADDLAARRTLLIGLSDALIAGIPLQSSMFAQLETDLAYLSALAVSPGEPAPLSIWLENVERRLRSARRIEAEEVARISAELKREQLQGTARPTPEVPSRRRPRWGAIGLAIGLAILVALAAPPLDLLGYAGINRQLIDDQDGARVVIFAPEDDAALINARDVLERACPALNVSALRPFAVDPAPWREVHACAIDVMARLDPKPAAIALDFWFEEDAPRLEALSSAIGRAKDAGVPVVLGVPSEADRIPVKHLERGAALGALDVGTDEGLQLLERLPLYRRISGAALPHLALETYSLARDRRSAEIGFFGVRSPQYLRGREYLWVHYAKTEPRWINYRDLFILDARTLAAQLGGRAVFIGAAGEYGRDDIHRIPANPEVRRFDNLLPRDELFTSEYGVFVLAHVFNQLETRKVIAEPTALGAALQVLASVLFGGLASAFARRRAWLAMPAAAVALAVLWSLPAPFPVFAMLGAALTGVAIDHAFRWKKT